MDNALPALSAIPVRRKSGQEPFVDDSGATVDRLQGFMSWACSDLLGNTMRGLLAEYIVGLALGCVREGVRVEWDAADLLTARGKLIEVKSSAYLQSWEQGKHSAISFDIRPTLGWAAATNEYSAERKRQADVYVFCVFAHMDKATADPLNLAQWDFHVVSTARLDEAAPKQKTITLGSLMARVRPRQVRFGGLMAAVEGVAV